MPRTKSTKKTNVGPAVTPGAATPVSEPIVTTAAVTLEPAKKPTIVASNPSKIATDSRARLLPINVDDEIRRLAYLMSEHRGFEPGHEAEDWLNAEREVRQRYRQQSA